MQILKVELEGFFEGSVDVTVKSNNQIEKFVVQTTDGEFRGELGCLILCYGADNDSLQQEDYPDFDFDTIIAIAESFLDDITQEYRTDFKVDYCNVMILKVEHRITIVKENPQYINSATSAHQRRFEELADCGFESVDAAKKYLIKNEEELGLVTSYRYY